MIHPKHGETERKGVAPHDLAKTNIICLPDKDFTIKDSKIALIAGWGKGLSHLTIAPKKAYISRDGTVLYTYNFFDNFGSTCPVSKPL